MEHSDFNGILIQFQGEKLALHDFVQKNQESEKEHIQAIINFIKDWQSNTPYILQKTSGSTGIPKLIKISKKQIKASALATLNTLAIKNGENALLCINPEYIGGKMMIARAIIGGVNLNIAEIVGNPLKNYKTNDTIHFFSFVPYQLEKILEESPEKIEFLDQAKVIILGGAPVSDILAQKIRSNLINAKVYSTYGMTETVSHVALKLINAKNEEPFKALEGIKFSMDERQCLIIHAPEVSGQEKLVTTDVVKLVSSTEFHWLGRHDYVINSGGIKIHPEVLEKEIAVIFQRFDIKNRFFIFGISDEKLGESVNLMMEGEAEGVYDILRENLHAFHVPKKIFQVERFEETDNGKINRNDTIKKR